MNQLFILADKLSTDYFSSLFHYFIADFILLIVFLTNDFFPLSILHFHYLVVSILKLKKINASSVVQFVCYNLQFELQIACSFWIYWWLRANFDEPLQ